MTGRSPSIKTSLAGSGDRMRHIVRLGICGLLLALAVPASLAEEPPRSVRVATRVLPPMVIDEHGRLTGFSIELWNSIAAKLKMATEYQVAPDVGALLEDVRSGKADLGISAISITAERDRQFDFSQPMLEAGLQILVRGNGESGPSNPLLEFLRLLTSPTIAVWLGIAALLIVIPAHIVWLVERRHEQGIIPDRRYFPGIFHAMWWAGSTLATQAEQMPRHWLARVLAILWMFIGVVFVAYYTAQLTASLTVREIRGAISGPDDLPGKRVATTRNSTAAAYLRQKNVDVVEVEQIDAAYKALLDKQVDAVVFDAPALLYYVGHDGKGKVQLVGPVFRKENFGIAFPLDSRLRSEVDRALLDLREDGTYSRLEQTWFGGQ
jgi:polar amino acid transport system substrate-binding protein